MPRARVAWMVALAATLAFAPSFAAAQGRPRMVADLVRDPLERSGVDHLVAVGDRLYFAGDDGEHGPELWRSDGTADGTVLVADVRPGPQSSRLHSLTAVGERVFFVADDGVHGIEPWVSDGTPEGTHVLDVVPGPTGSLPHELVALGDELLFAARDDEGGVELWASDGTPEGTRRVADLNPGPESSSPSRLTAAGGLVFFVADDGVHGPEPWLTDGTDEGTFLLADLRQGPEGSQPGRMLAVGDAVYFGAVDDAGEWALWRADLDGVTLVADVDLEGLDAELEPLVALEDGILFRVSHPSLGSEVWRTGEEPGDEQLVVSFVPHFDPYVPREAVAMGGNAYFVGFDPIGGAVLLRTDGTAAGTEIIADLNVFPCSAEFGPPIVVGDRLFFRANQGKDRGELWTSDGTAEGTQLVKDIFPGNGGSRPASLTAVGSTLFFRASDGLHGRELWKSDGTPEGTEIVADVYPGSIGAFDETFPRLSPAGSVVLFGRGSGEHPSQLAKGLWRSDGTEAGTAPVPGTEDWYVGSYLFIEAATRTYFFAGNALWRTDGTDAGTQLAVTPAPPLGFDQEYAVAGDGFFFAGETSSTGAELWFTDGTPSGTRLVRDIVPGAAGSEPRELVVAGERAFFSAATANGRELWVSDGTEEGTRLVKDIRPGFLASGLGEATAYLTPVGDVVYFVADDASTGRELWRSDGTPEGTFRVRDIRPGQLGALPVNFRPRAFGDLVLFAADDGASGLELWRSDGSAAGTVRVKDIRPGPSESRPVLLGIAGRWMYLSADDGEHGQELWRTDGTEAGTVLVKDINPGKASSRPRSGVAVGDAFYFVATTDEHGEELWVTDGTEEGTRLVDDLNPTGDAEPWALTNAAGRLFFVADDGVHGTELWALSCGDGLLDESEECDEGALNGTPTSCCTALCTLHRDDLDGDGIGDRCDPVDATLDLRRAQVRADAPTPRVDGTIVLDGHLSFDPARGDVLDPADGITVTVRDAAGLAEAATWDAASCRTTKAGVIHCRNAGKDAVVRFRPAGRDATGLPRLFFRVKLAGRALTGPFTGPLEATITHGAQIDRTGNLARCTPTPRGLRCVR
ncbi:MAG TPA: ELWxxDGT repeat protein [Candidatus Binatia bacterium]